MIERLATVVVPASLALPIPSMFVAVIVVPKAFVKFNVVVFSVVAVIVVPSAFVKLSVGKLPVVPVTVVAVRLVSVAFPAAICAVASVVVPEREALPRTESVPDVVKFRTSGELV